jgi:mercuric ion binding protein
MKTRIILSLLAIFFLAVTSQAQDKKNDKKKQLVTIEIQTSAICGQCKERLEHEMAFEKGVKFVELDNDTKILTIKYKEGKNTKENLKVAITKIGYDADDLIADQEAHDALPKCCQKGNDPH